MDIATALVDDCRAETSRDEASRVPSGVNIQHAAGDVGGAVGVGFIANDHPVGIVDGAGAEIEKAVGSGPIFANPRPAVGHIHRAAIDVQGAGTVSADEGRSIGAKQSSALNIDRAGAAIITANRKFITRIHELAGVFDVERAGAIFTDVHLT